MPKGLKRIYGFGHLHFLTFSCYRRLPLLGSAGARNTFVQVLGDVRDRYGFNLVGYVVMPEHVHLLISEPARGTPSTVLQVLKQDVSRVLRRDRPAPGQRTPSAGSESRLPQFWQSRFYDFNVWSQKKKVEKLAYMHMNPVKRGLAEHPKDWPWSSYAFYERRGEILIRIDRWIETPRSVSPVGDSQQAPTLNNRGLGHPQNQQLSTIKIRNQVSAHRRTWVRCLDSGAAHRTPETGNDDATDLFSIQPGMRPPEFFTPTTA